MSSKSTNYYSPSLIIDQSNFDRYSDDVAPPILELGDNDLFCKSPKKDSKNSSLYALTPRTNLPMKMRKVSFDTCDAHNMLAPTSEICDTDSYDYCADDCPLSPSFAPIRNIQRFCETPPPVTRKDTEEPPLIKRPSRLHRFDSNLSDCPLMPTFELDSNLHPSQNTIVPFPLADFSNCRLNREETCPFQLLPRMNQERDTTPVPRINQFLPIAQP